jgi:mRNA interferase MazF
VLILQSDVFNSTRIKTVVVAIITSNVRLGGAPGNVPLSPRQSGLRKPSVVNVSQLVSLDRRVLTERVAAVPRRVLARVDAGLRLVLSI